VGVLYSLANELGSSLDHLLFGAGVRRPGAAAASPDAASPDAAGPGAAGPGAQADRGPAPPTAPGPGIVQRGGGRSIIDLASGVRWERLTPGADAMTDFLEVIYSPGGHSTDERRPLRHDGHEYGLVISGTLQANVGFESYELGPGDSIAFDSSTPHEYLNKTGEPVHAIWVVIHSAPGRALYVIVDRYPVQDEVAVHDVPLRVADHVYWRYCSRIGRGHRAAHAVDDRLVTSGARDPHAEDVVELYSRRVGGLEGLLVE
jgi:mannose-6-phosphate isomerase-like protein (cupin superfamily)